MLDIVELKLEEGHKAVFAFLHSVLAQPFPDPVRIFEFILQVYMNLPCIFQGETVVAKTISFAKNEKGEEDYKPEVFRLTRSDNDYEYLEYVRTSFPLCNNSTYIFYHSIFRLLSSHYLNYWM